MSGKCSERWLCRIWGSRSSDYEEYYLLGYKEVWSSKIPPTFRSSACNLFLAGFCLDLIFNPEDRENTFLRNVGGPFEGYYCILECDSVQFDTYLSTFQRNVPPPILGSVYPQYGGSRFPWNFSSVHQTTRRHISGDSNFHSPLYEKFKSQGLIQNWHVKFMSVS
jgi:hypothetical protein